MTEERLPLADLLAKGMHPVNTAPLVTRGLLALAGRFRLSVRPR